MARKTADTADRNLLAEVSQRAKRVDEIRQQIADLEKEDKEQKRFLRKLVMLLNEAPKGEPARVNTGEVEVVLAGGEPRNIIDPAKLLRLAEKRVPDSQARINALAPCLRVSWKEATDSLKPFGIRSAELRAIAVQQPQEPRVIVHILAGKKTKGKEAR